MDKFARFNFQPCLPLGKDGRRVTASKEHIEISRRASAEGIVLLKNENNTLPLKKGTKIALFGKATIEYIKGGGGSGDVNCPYISGIYDGFAEKEAEGKVSVFMPLIDFYKDYVKRGAVNCPTDEQIDATWNVVNNMEFCQLRDDMTYDTFDSMHVKEADVPAELINQASEFSSTAIFTISRFSAEGTDRRNKGGDYILSETEKKVLNALCDKFDKIVVLVNSGAQIDCEDFALNSKVGAVAFVWQGGMEGGKAVADVICGDVNPSGKLPDTVTTTYECYPSKDEMIESFDFNRYSEDIYVGYRYFNTIPGMDKYIRYPFGFGLSYTTFDIFGVIAGCDGKTVTVAFNVKNTGNVAGKEVVQVYYSAPQGKLGKPKIALGAYKKTKLLAPGESCALAVSFDVYTMASFDDTGKIQKSAYVLEKGEYKFFIGNSSDHLTELGYKYKSPEDIVIEQLKPYCRPYEAEKRLLADGTYEILDQGTPSYYYGEPETEKYIFTETKIPFDEVGKTITLSDFVNQFTLDEMKNFVGGQAPTGVCNTGCFGGLKRLKVPAVPTADGPAGLRLNKETGIPTTAFPSATSLAATWNEDLVFKVGSAAAAEIRENNIGVWLAPACNIHRNPMCGRNFEYMSEDPVLAGKQVAAEIRGIQSQKVAVSLKHFACNNKEPNRYQNNSILSERALREIYLKVFEIAVKEGRPLTVMSSYNLINGLHTSENWELLTGILRKEWGFDGMVVTDWGVKNNPVLEVKAGNDMKMHCGYPEDLQKGLDEGVITPDHLKVCVMRILDMMLKLAD